MNDTRELERHNRIMERIKNAKTIEELPKIGYSDISTFLANNAHFKGGRLNQSDFKPVVDKIKEYGTFSHQDVLQAFIEVIEVEYPRYTDSSIITLYNNLAATKRVDYILEEISERNKKIEDFAANTNLKYHLEVMEKIKNAHEIGELPKVGLSELKQKIISALKNTCYRYDRNNKTYIQYITDVCLGASDNSNLVEAATPVITACLNVDKTIQYTSEEIRAINKRKLEIYKENHEETMANIKNAKRISQLPPNLSVSILNSYLLGNSTIYTKDNRIKSADLKKIVELLLAGSKWYQDEKLNQEVEHIAYSKYFDKPNAYERLYVKLASLPRTYYLVDEIRYAQERQKEFIRNQNSNVNVYFIPNDKTPVEGGRFYNCYINRKENIDLDALIPANMDIDAVEWYVQEHIDDTFKTAGGIILNNDETIGNVSVFRPNDGTIGISPEEKAKMDKINDLDKELEEKQQLVEALDIVIANKQQTSSELESKIKIALINYERTVLEAQKSLATHMEQLKQEFGIKTIEGPTYNKKN